MSGEGVCEVTPLSVAAKAVSDIPQGSLVEFRPHAYPDGLLCVDDEKNVCAICKCKSGDDEKRKIKNAIWFTDAGDGEGIGLVNRSECGRLVLRVKEGKLETIPIDTYDDVESCFRTEVVPFERKTIRLYLEYPTGLHPTTKYYVTIKEDGFPGCAKSDDPFFEPTHSNFTWTLTGDNDTSWANEKITVQSRLELCHLAICKDTVKLIESLEGVKIKIHKEDGGLYTFESTANNFEGSFLNVCIDDDDNKKISAGPKTDYSYFRLFRLSDMSIVLMSNKYILTFLCVKKRDQSEVLDLTNAPMNPDAQWVFEEATE
ncbi:uncharacterized protein [Oscarella lobularis]|uniref:uncharacterized protein n=1 Tax=Oscarella lobularis TaxID=121494 RepID=UPI003313D611